MKTCLHASITFLNKKKQIKIKNNIKYLKQYENECKLNKLCKNVKLKNKTEKN